MPLNLRVASTLIRQRLAFWTVLVLISGIGLSGCGTGTSDAATRGKELFETCVPCHQQDGSGSSEFGAPNIAGMKQWYVEAQLNKFRGGVRGMQFNDTEGMRMRPMALSLLSEDDVKSVAHYVETLPPVPHGSSLGGDPKAGEALYATCSSCHGDDGSGKVEVKAPRIAGTDDWYLATQIRKFKTGVRGANPKDTEGRLMRTIARTVPNEDALRNVLAYVETLKPQPQGGDK
jgi:cytochrome c553